MTTTTFNAAPSNATDASFRAWGGGLSTALAAVGMVKTADTGQINWSTVLAPTGASTYQGYEIWRLNDSVQSTAPIFFKIEYGSGTSSASNIALRITIGKGSDGAGAITGVIQAALGMPTTNNSVTASAWYVSGGDGSMLGIVGATGYFLSASVNFHLVFDRSRAANQTATGTGAHLTNASTGTAQTTRVYNYAAATTYTSTYKWPGLIPVNSSSATTLASGGKAPLFPSVLTDGLGNYWQPRSSLIGLSVDLGSFVTMTVTGFGTYMGMGTGTNGYDAGGITLAQLALLWE